MRTAHIVRSRPFHPLRRNLKEPDSPARTVWKERPMEHDYPEQPGWVRLPGYDEDPRYPHGTDDQRDYRRAAGARVSGVRRVRQASNWTAALLIAGVAATTGYFAHHAAPAAPAAVTSVPGGTAATGAHKPSLSGPVATSTGSGVTVRTGPGGTRIVSYRDN